MAASVGVASNIDGRVGEQGEVNRLKAVQNKARPNSTKRSRVFFSLLSLFKKRRVARESSDPWRQNFA